MPHITVELSERDVIDLEALARYMKFGCRAEDAIETAVRSTLVEFRNERIRRLNMEDAERELESAMSAYVRSDVKEYFERQTVVSV